MGRKRVSRGKTREPVTISLPRDLIITLDSTIPEEHTRSRLIEKLVIKHLEVNTKITDFNRHLYVCVDCTRQFTLNRHLNPYLLVCRGPKGCNGDHIRYLGIYEEGEEE